MILSLWEIFWAVRIIWSEIDKMGGCNQSKVGPVSAAANETSTGSIKNKSFSFWKLFKKRRNTIRVSHRLRSSERIIVPWFSCVTRQVLWACVALRNHKSTFRTAVVWSSVRPDTLIIDPRYTRSSHRKHTWCNGRFGFAEPHNRWQGLLCARHL